MVLKFVPYRFILRGIEMFVSITRVLSKRFSGLNHYLNITTDDKMLNVKVKSSSKYS